MLKTAFSLGAHAAFEEQGFTKESLAPWASGALKGSGIGALLGAGTSAAVTGADPKSIGVGAGIGALGGGLSGAALSTLKHMDLRAIEKAESLAEAALAAKKKARNELIDFLDSLPG